jgi:hypothetical protein
LVSNWSVTVNAGLKLALDAIEASPSGEIKEELVRLHDRISEVDSSARTMFATAYQQWRGDPCNNQVLFDKAISNILNFVIELTKVTYKIKHLKSEEKVLFIEKHSALGGGRKGGGGSRRCYYHLEKRSPRINRNIRSSILILDTVDSELTKRSRNLKEQIKKKKSAARAKYNESFFGEDRKRKRSKNKKPKRSANSRKNS